MLIFLAVMAFIFVGFLTLKPIIISHKYQFKLWLMGYAAIAISIVIGIFITNDILIKIVVGLFLAVLALLAYKIVIKKLQYSKILKAKKNDLDTAVEALVSGKNVNRDIALWAIEQYRDGRLVSLRTIYEIASNKYTPLFVLEYLSTLELGYDIILGLAQNPTSSPDILAVIADNMSLPEDIVDAMLENPNLNDSSIGVMIANIDSFYKIVNGTSPYQASVTKCLISLRDRQPELQGIEDRFIIAQYSKSLV